MINQKGPSRGPQELRKNLAKGYGNVMFQANSISSAVAAGLAIHELDRLKALELLPTPDILMERLRARTDDFNLLVGVAAAYLAKGL